MSKCGDELKELAHRMMKEKWDYKTQTKKYVRQVMGFYRQQELIDALPELNYKELKMISGCGIPGDAWKVGFELLKQKRQEIELLIEEHGLNAKATVETEDPTEESDNGNAGVQTP